MSTFATGLVIGLVTGPFLFLLALFFWCAMTKGGDS